MAQMYGNRWQLIDRLGGGGQGEVFRARDSHREQTEIVALKRVFNPKRRDRFRAEVSAIKQLDHKNVIKLIDHSALDADADILDKQFLVMPLASEDLSKRAALYKGKIDSTLDVALQLAMALQSAHRGGIIHRDVKPPNILFPTNSHEVWLADFGICLIRENERHTPPMEVVGPVQFMAPELEEGGKLDVTAAVDVYSLGKVIYYMISGGIILPRERLSEQNYSNVFDQGGERYRLLRILLSRMICSLDRRIISMADVIAELGHEPIKVIPESRVG